MAQFSVVVHDRETTFLSGPRLLLESQMVKNHCYMEAMAKHKLE